MLAERFVIDDAGFEFSDESPRALEASFGAFNELLGYALGSLRGVTKWSQLWFVESASGRPLHELLYDPKVDRDLRNLLLGRLDKLPSWDDDPNLAPPSDVTCGGASLPLAPGVGLCALAATQQRGIGCLTTLHAGRRGTLDVTLPGGECSSVSFLVTEDDAPMFWRRLIDLEDLNAGGIEDLCHLAFPRLMFIPGIWGQASGFEGGFRDVVRTRLVRDLAGLSDHGPDVWRDHVEPARIAAEMAGRAGVSCSRDSPQTHRDAAAMRQRRVEYDGKTFECEWHIKLEPNRNRIHFAVDGDEAVVGIFTRHLR